MKKQFWVYIIIILIIAIIGFLLDYLIINSDLPLLWKWVLLK